ncbi:MAG: class I SAM-dependent methyltransferase [Acidimicrobiia bacterium]
MSDRGDQTILSVMAREQRLVFGEVADVYDRARPDYPDSVVDDVAAFACLGDDSRILEVGCGTGKATVPFGARGFTVVALEPSSEMAAVARRNCAPFPKTEVVVSSFEDWSGDGGAFDAVVCATAWHWVQPGIRLEKAHAALAASGALALFWHRPDWPDTPLRRAIDTVYRDVAPTLHARLPGMSPQDVGRRQCVEELEASRLFGPVEHSRHAWHREYSRDEYLELLDTQSNHRLLEPGARERLFDGIGRAIDDAGGTVPVEYSVELHLARRVG